MIVFSSRVSEEAPAINFETWGTKGLPRKYSFFSRFLFPSLGRSLSLFLSFSLTRSLSLPLSLGHTLSPSRRPPCSLHLLPSLDLPPRGARWLTSGTKTKIPAYPVEGEGGRRRRQQTPQPAQPAAMFLFSCGSKSLYQATLLSSIRCPRSPCLARAFVLSLPYLDFTRSFYPSRFTSAFSRSHHCASAHSRREGCPHIESHINIPVKVPRVV